MRAGDGEAGGAKGPSVRLTLWDFGQVNAHDTQDQVTCDYIACLQCDKKKCSGSKLVRLGVCSEISKNRGVRGICLTPVGTRTVTSC